MYLFALLQHFITHLPTNERQHFFLTKKVQEFSAVTNIQVAGYVISRRGIVQQGSSLGSISFCFLGE